MSVILGEVGELCVHAADYDADCIRIEYESEEVNIMISLDRKDMQELSKIIDRFLS